MPNPTNLDESARPARQVGGKTCQKCLRAARNRPMRQEPAAVRGTVPTLPDDPPRGYVNAREEEIRRPRNRSNVDLTIRDIVFCNCLSEWIEPMKKVFLLAACLCGVTLDAAVAMDPRTALPQDPDIISKLAKARYPVATALPESPDKISELAEARYPIALTLPQDPATMVELAEAGYRIAMALPRNPAGNAELAEARYPITVGWPQLSAEAAKLASGGQPFVVTWPGVSGRMAEPAEANKLPATDWWQTTPAMAGIARGGQPFVATEPEILAWLAGAADPVQLEATDWWQTRPAVSELAEAGLSIAVALPQEPAIMSELAGAGYLVAVALTQEPAIISELAEAGYPIAVAFKVNCISSGGTWEDCVPGTNDWRKGEEVSGWLDGTTYEKAFLDAMQGAVLEQEGDAPWFGAIARGPRWGVNELVSDAYVQPLSGRDMKWDFSTYSPEKGIGN